jgi:ArsR family transcriptional regulator, lead/cadmium/zinc/bismuth-responsive transcriptional repressor
VAKQPLVECDGSHPISRPQPLPPSQSIERAANLFRALGEPSRLRLLSRLIDGSRCVGELAEAENEAMSTISQRLRVLRAENIVVRRRNGKHIHYGLVDRHVTNLVLNALAHADEAQEIEAEAEQNDGSVERN